MQFNSLHFMIYFPIVLMIYFFIPKKLREIWLLISSYYFYMSWNPKYAVLIAASTIITYLSAIIIEKASTYAEKWKKIVLILCLVSNLAILGIFKYGNFILDSLDNLVKGLNIGEIDWRFNLLLPVGISFYTFQALGYIIDVYRKLPVYFK